MTGFTRAKRVSGPFGDEVRARLFGSSISSGSEHSGDMDGDDSPCLSKLVQSFLEGGEDDAEPRGYTESESDSDSDEERVASAADCTDVAEEIARSVKNCLKGDSYGSILLVHVLKASEMFSSFQGSEHTQPAVFRRKVMSSLRELGHNAAICKTKWSSSGGLTAGSYEFIDVVAFSQSRDATCQAVRYFIDLEFSSQFEIARSTSQYARELQSLPRIFVGKSDDLKRIVRLTCDAARRSLKSRGLTVPPWRKNRYMQTRWIGPYKRTTNLMPSTNAVNSVVTCRAVGFDDGVNGRMSVRTR